MTLSFSSFCGNPEPLLTLADLVLDVPHERSEARLVGGVGVAQHPTLEEVLLLRVLLQRHEELAHCVLLLPNNNEILMTFSDLYLYFFFFIFFLSTGLVRLYIAGLPLRSCQTIGAPPVQGSPNVRFFVSGSSRIRTHVLIITKRMP